MSAAAPPAIPLPPPGLTYVAALKPALTLLLVVVIWSSFLVPIAIALFYFSTARFRRQPIFIVNVVTISLGIAQSVIHVYSTIRTMLLLPVQGGVETAFACMSMLIPMFVESVLVFRVVAAYPPRLLSWRRRLAVYAPIVVVKTARLTNSIVFITHWLQAARSSVSSLQAGQDAWNGPNIKVECVLQLFDASFTSALFLLRLRQSTKRNEGVIVDSAPAGPKKRSYSSRLRTLFWIAVSNFVLPVMLTFAELVFAFCDSNFLDGEAIFLVNTYVQIIGVVLATIWCTAPEPAAAAAAGAGATVVATDIKFATVPVGDEEASCPSFVGRFGDDGASDSEVGRSGEYVECKRGEGGCM